MYNKGIEIRKIKPNPNNPRVIKDSVSGMGNMVFEMLSNGWTDDEICNHLGMEPEEILKLKHITGFSKLFADKEFNKSWQTNRMIKIKKDYENGLK